MANCSLPTWLVLLVSLLRMKMILFCHDTSTCSLRHQQLWKSRKMQYDEVKEFRRLILSRSWPWAFEFPVNVFMELDDFHLVPSMSCHTHISTSLKRHRKDSKYDPTLRLYYAKDIFLWEGGKKSKPNTHTSWLGWSNHLIKVLVTTGEHSRMSPSPKKRLRTLHNWKQLDHNFQST